MKQTVDKCEQCGALFEDPQRYSDHAETHKKLTVLEETFPKVPDDGCEFANGEWYVLRDADWLTRYKDAVVAMVGKTRYTPWSHGWFRLLDDGGSPYYGAACRALNVCETCYREWGQSYYANNCQHIDKRETR